MHDPRVGRFFAVDPLAGKYPYNSPYAFSENMVIHMIELEGLEASSTRVNNVWFITLRNPDIDLIVRKSNQTLTEAAKANNNNLTVSYSVNLQQYEATTMAAKAAYAWGPSSPQPIEEYRAQGESVQNKKVISGRSSPLTFSFSQSPTDCSWSCSQGDVDNSAPTGFGGGIPLCVDGLQYGEKNIYKKGAPAGLPEKGDPRKGNRKYLLQRSNAGYSAQNSRTVGKTVIGYNSSSKEWILVVQKDGKDGMTMDEIRDKLIGEGYDNILSFDGSTSSALVKNETVVVNPAARKNNTAPTGITFSVSHE